jgi:hypothetical protein
MPALDAFLDSEAEAVEQLLDNAEANYEKADAKARAGEPQDAEPQAEALNFSELMLRQKVGDDAAVDAAVAKFKELAKDNKPLQQELRDHQDPYKFAYDYVKKTQAMAEIGDPAAYRAKLEADIRAKIEAEYAGTVSQQPRDPAAKPWHRPLCGASFGASAEYPGGFLGHSAPSLITCGRLARLLVRAFTRRRGQRAFVCP